MVLKEYILWKVKYRKTVFLFEPTILKYILTFLHFQNEITHTKNGKFAKINKKNIYLKNELAIGNGKILINTGMKYLSQTGICAEEEAT